MLHNDFSAWGGAGGQAWDREKNITFLRESTRILDASSSRWTLQELYRALQSVLRLSASFLELQTYSYTKQLPWLRI